MRVIWTYCRDWQTEAAPSWLPAMTTSQSILFAKLILKAYGVSWMITQTQPIIRLRSLVGAQKKIVQWANYVIQGDPDRPVVRPALRAADRAADGQVALLAFAGNVSEAQGIARLVHHLIVDRHLPSQEILILVRSDHYGLFTTPIKEALRARGILFSDPSEVKEILENDQNRRALSLLRLFVHGEDSLAWASLLYLTDGIGPTFFDYIYEKAKAELITFGAALCADHKQKYPGLSRALARRATNLVADTLQRISAAQVPQKMPEKGWGTWISDMFDDTSDIKISNQFRELLTKIDERVEPVDDLGRYLGQITPIAKDIALEKSDKVRIMTLAGSKGLTVKAAIIAGLETGFIRQGYRFSTGEDPRKREAALWARWQKLKAQARGTSIVDLLVGVSQDGLSSIERSLYELEMSSLLPENR
jgi:superfamily I DNA/RNA helicase